MGDSDLRAETREKVKKEAVTKIHGQPSHTAITKLKEELVKIAVVFPTSLGGGELGHAGLIIKANAIHLGSRKAGVRLCSQSRGSNTHVQSKRHGPCRT